MNKTAVSSVSLFLTISVVLFGNSTYAVQESNLLYILEIRWNDNDTRLAAGFSSGEVKIWDANSGHLMHTLIGHADMVQDIRWHGDLLATGSYDQTVKIWNSSNGMELKTLEFPDAVMGIAWHPFLGQLFVTILGKDNLFIFDTSDYSLISRQSVGSIGQFSWNSTGDRIVGANIGGITQIFDGATLERLVRFEDIHPSEFDSYGVYVVDWHPIDNLVASGSFDGSIQIWDVTSEQLVFRLDGTNSETIEWQESAIKDLFFNVDGSQLTSVSADGLIRTWDPLTGHILHEQQLPVSELYAAAFSSDGTQVAVGGLIQGDDKPTLFAVEQSKQ